MTDRDVARAQGFVYVATGLWPIVHMRSFEAVTGKKADRWLVRTMGALIASVGAGLLVGGAGSKILTPMRVVATLSAASLGFADVWYSLRGRISRVYLADAALEALVLAGWLTASRRGFGVREAPTAHDVEEHDGQHRRGGEGRGSAP